MLDNYLPRLLLTACPSRLCCMRPSERPSVGPSIDTVRMRREKPKSHVWATPLPQATWATLSSAPLARGQLRRSTWGGPPANKECSWRLQQPVLCCQSVQYAGLKRRCHQVRTPHKPTLTRKRLRPTSTPCRSTSRRSHAMPSYDGSPKASSSSSMKGAPCSSEPGSIVTPADALPSCTWSAETRPTRSTRE
jgi:hypothetical protein